MKNEWAATNNGDRLVVAAVIAIGLIGMLARVLL
jgi:hypothetical protein